MSFRRYSLIGLASICLQDSCDRVITAMGREYHLPLACQPSSYGVPCLGFHSYLLFVAEGRLDGAVK